MQYRPDATARVVQQWRKGQAGHQTRNRKSDPGRISYLRTERVRSTQTSVLYDDYRIPYTRMPAFLIARFLILKMSWQCIQEKHIYILNIELDVPCLAENFEPDQKPKILSRCHIL